MNPSTRVDAPADARGVTAQDSLQTAIDRLSESASAFSRRTGSSRDLLDRVRRLRLAAEQLTTLSVLLARSRGLDWLSISDQLHLPAQALELRMRRLPIDLVTP